MLSFLGLSVVRTFWQCFPFLQKVFLFLFHFLQLMQSQLHVLIYSIVGICNYYLLCHLAGLQHLSDSVPELPLLKRQDPERPGSRMPDDEEDEREDEQWLRRRPPNHEQRLSREFCLACSDSSVVLWMR